MRDLTEQQTAVLARLARWDTARDGAISGPELSRVMGRRLRDYASDKLRALEKRGLVTRLGSTFSGAATWVVTEAGRLALAEQEKGR